MNTKQNLRSFFQQSLSSQSVPAVDGSAYFLWQIFTPDALPDMCPHPEPNWVSLMGHANVLTTTLWSTQTENMLVQRRYSHLFGPLNQTASEGVSRSRLRKLDRSHNARWLMMCHWMQISSVYQYLGYF